MESIKKKIPLGSRALDFRLHDIATGELVDLAELRKSKPVAIILGSFGCDVICRHFAPLTKLHEKYKDCAHFLFVYVKEGPHSELLPGSAKAEDRLARIRRGLRHFAVPFPCLIDLPNQAVQKAYNGFPMRVLAVDRAGRFAWDSGSVFTPLNLDGLEDWLKGQPASN